ncbi:hypothetical protein BD410DRAFT_896751 [Rickenella mellea]|uniref:Uncharacterized protein n=1 Tax=Rickenella mellea TaxID=50990 RepID=A0A4Y7QBE9_9AGAM|nr:hypothetical protein BD410DRAFT_896751 [Rickenella mellea]
MILGRAVKNEYLSLGVILGTTGIAYAATRGGGAKKDAHHKPAAGSSLKDKIESVKAAVPFGAGSSEEEQLMDSIKKFIEDEEKKTNH